MVGHPPDVRSVVLAKDGILSGVSSGRVLVDCTSSHPTLAREIASAARAKGCWAIDAPVAGGYIGARDGKVALLAGGDTELVGWLQPLFKILGKATHVGTAGCWQSCKIANQIVVGSNLLGLSEGLVFAEKAGLDLQEYIEALGGGVAGSNVMELFGKRVIEKDFKPGGFVEYMVNDLGMGLVDQVVLPGAAFCKESYLGIVANGDGKLGTPGIITVIQRINGMYNLQTLLSFFEYSSLMMHVI